MGQPDWTRITPNGKPFGYEDPAVSPLNEKLEKLQKENDILKKENEQLRELLEEEKEVID